MTLDNYSRRIALILTNNMSTIVIISVFQLGNAYVALPFNFSNAKAHVSINVRTSLQPQNFGVREPSGFTQSSGWQL